MAARADIEVNVAAEIAETDLGLIAHHFDSAVQVVDFHFAVAATVGTSPNRFSVWNSIARSLGNSQERAAEDLHLIGAAHDPERKGSRPERREIDGA